MIVVLAGGVGAARFLEGVVQVVPPEQVAAVVNTGDDMQLMGLHISPDVDIVTCTLAGVIDQAQGWGIAGDTDQFMQWMGVLGGPTWFKLGDRDLALHVRRSDLLRQGHTLSQVAEQFRLALGCPVRVLPMSDDRVETHIVTAQGVMHFEEYFVRHRTQIEVLGVEFHGADLARPAPGVLEAIREADAVLIAPSNPIVSVGTILAVPGIRAALAATAAPVVAVSPIVGGAAIKGPAVPLMRAHGLEASALGVASYYRDLIDALVIDNADAELAAPIRALGIDVHVTDTIMRDPAAKRHLAAVTLHAANLGQNAEF
ncbi:MAG: 2-phospho-L-lactate transferase [Roseiflexaceae bacterium]|nr:2-phospho-L-lactate transferase [Roseiflexaceae bacterium]